MIGIAVFGLVLLGSEPMNAKAQFNRPQITQIERFQFSASNSNHRIGPACLAADFRQTLLDRAAIASVLISYHNKACARIQIPAQLFPKLTLEVLLPFKNDKTHRCRRFLRHQRTEEYIHQLPG